MQFIASDIPWNIAHMMISNGLVKLSEESAEVIQVAQKLVAYPRLQTCRDSPHPDGTYLLERLEMEIGDVLAAIEFVSKKLNLNPQNVASQCEKKMKLFERWDLEP